MARISPYESGELTDSIFIILLSMLCPIHGYKVMQKVSDLTEGAIEIGPATMYTTIGKLCDAGWIYEIKTEGNKKQYIISDEGRRIVQKNYEYRAKLLSLATTMLNTDGGGEVNGKI